MVGHERSAPGRRSGGVVRVALPLIVPALLLLHVACSNSSDGGESSSGGSGSSSGGSPEGGTSKKLSVEECKARCEAKLSACGTKDAAETCSSACRRPITTELACLEAETCAAINGAFAPMTLCSSLYSEPDASGPGFGEPCDCGFGTTATCAGGTSSNGKTQLTCAKGLGCVQTGAGPGVCVAAKCCDGTLTECYADAGVEPCAQGTCKQIGDGFYGFYCAK